MYKMKEAALDIHLHNIFVKSDFKLGCYSIFQVCHAIPCYVIFTKGFILIISVFVCIFIFFNHIKSEKVIFFILPV